MSSSRIRNSWQIYSSPRIMLRIQYSNNNVTIALVSKKIKMNCQKYLILHVLFVTIYASNNLLYTLILWPSNTIRFSYKKNLQLSPMKHGHFSSLLYSMSDTRQCLTPTRHPHYVLYFGHYRCPRVRVRVVSGVRIGVGALQVATIQSEVILCRVKDLKTQNNKLESKWKRERDKKIHHFSPAPKSQLSTSFSTFNPFISSKSQLIVT